MKKFFSMVLSILLIFSVMSPVTVFAENGPYPFDPGSESLDFTEFSTLSITDMETYDMEILYPQTDTIFNGGLYPGASYNLKTNTLTLNNVKAKTSVINASEMGDDFKIKLIGYNELAGISSNATTRGASVTITGKGELVLNRDDVGFGIIIFAGETTSVLNIEETVKLKAYFSAESETPAISVFGSSIRSSAELINLGGKVVSDKPEFKKYTVNVYEQIEAYDLDWNYYDWYEFGLKKDGAYYIADAEYDEETYEPTGKYLVYSVKYDKLLDCYTLNEYANGEGVSLDGFTKITEFEPMLDEKRGFYIGYTDYPDEEDDSYKTIFYPQEKEPFDICVDKNGTKYGFIQYDYEEDDEFGTDTFVYKFIEHPKYGTVAVLDETKDSLDGLTPLKIAEKKLADKSYYSDVIINNGGSVTEPAKIKNIKANNTNQGVRITWSADSSATQYRIYRKAAGELYWKTLDTISASKTSFVDKTAKSGKKYTYTVKGYNYVGWGEANSKGTTITFYEVNLWYNNFCCKDIAFQLAI